MNFNYYLFDLDNCLIRVPNPMEYFDKILIKTLKILNIVTIPKKSNRLKILTSGNQFEHFLKKWGIYLEDYEFFWKVFDAQDFKARKKLMEKGEIKPYDDVVEVLNNLHTKGNYLAIISNTSQKIVEYTLKTFLMKSYFHYVFALGGENTQALAKPSSHGIEKALKALNFNTKKSRCLMIGDSIKDIYAGKEANISTCLIKRHDTKYSNGLQNWDYKPDLIIESLYELIPFF